MARLSCTRLSAFRSGEFLAAPAAARARRATWTNLWTSTDRPEASMIRSRETAPRVWWISD